MLLYHGSYKKFTNFELKYAKEGKDYGKGIYFIPNYDQAKKWAARKKGKGYIYIIEIPDEIFLDSEYNILNLNHYNKEWADIIVACRSFFYEPDYDIIYGKMADGRFWELEEYIDDYRNGKLKLASFILGVRCKQEYMQYCFKSEKAVMYINDRLKEVIEV